MTSPLGPGNCIKVELPFYMVPLLCLKNHKMAPRSISPEVEIYCAKVQSAALYGAEIWGYANTTELTAKENVFMRSLFRLPQSTPIVLLYFNTGLKRVGKLADLRPLLF